MLENTAYTHTCKMCHGAPSTGSLELPEQFKYTEEEKTVCLSNNTFTY